VEYDLPDEIQSVVSLQLLDAAGDEIANTLTYNVDYHRITFYDWLGGTLTALPTGSDTIRVKSVYVPEALAAITDEPQIKSDYHDALLWKVLEGKLALAGDYNGVKYADKVWKENVHAAKKYANTSGNSSQVNITRDDY
jgi:hypothetical protein